MKSALMMVLVVTAAPLGVFGDIQTAIDDAIDEVTDVVFGEDDAVILGTESNPEYQFRVNRTMEHAVSFANNHPDHWKTYGNITDYARFGIVVRDGQTAVANRTLHVDWENRTVNTSVGITNPDVTVYPRYKDVVYLDQYYENVTDLDATPQTVRRVWSIWRNTQCEPKTHCQHIRDLYGLQWDRLIGKVI